MWGIDTLHYVDHNHFRRFGLLHNAAGTLRTAMPLHNIQPLGPQTHQNHPHSAKRSA